MAIDLKPHVAKSSHVPQVNHAGEHRQVETAPGMFNPNDRTRLGEHQNVKADLGKAPKPKAHGPVKAHGGMFSRTRDGLHVQGVTQTTLANAPDASGVAPLDPTVPGKKLSPPKVGFGQRTMSVHGKVTDDVLQRVGAVVLANAKRN